MSMFRLALNRPTRKGRSTGPSRFLAFCKNTSGGVLIYTGIGLIAFLGFGGLAVDVGYWYATKRSAQSAADASALAGALEVARGTDAATMLSMAKADAAQNGYSTASGATITINNPPLSGAYVGDADAVEAIIQQPVPGFLSRLLNSDSITVAARSVARGFKGKSCLYVMDPSEDAALAVYGKAVVNMDCGAQVNSDSPTAVDQTGGKSCLTATSIKTYGGYSGNCLNPTPVNTPRVEDPFEYLSPPTVGPCDYVAHVEVLTPTTLDPGVYCGGLTLKDDVTLNPGTYVVDGAGLQIESQAVVDGDDVSFYFPPTVTGELKGTTMTSLYIAGGADVELSAPTAGTYQNMLFYMDPAVDPNIELWLQGGSAMELEGIIYATEHHMRFAGGSETDDGWLVALVDTIEFVGNSYMQGPEPTVDLPYALVAPTLVE